MTGPLGQSLQPSLTSRMGGALLERRIYGERVTVGLGEELERDLSEVVRMEIFGNEAEEGKEESLGSGTHN